MQNDTTEINVTVSLCPFTDSRITIGFPSHTTYTARPVTYNFTRHIAVVKSGQSFEFCQHSTCWYFGMSIMDNILYIIMLS